MTLEELEAEVMKLNQASRAELLRRLAASLAGPQQSQPAQAPVPPPTQTEEQKEREWLQEALRRSRELRERQIQTEPPDRRPAAPANPALLPFDGEFGEKRHSRGSKKRAAKHARPKPSHQPKSKAKPKRKPRPKPRPALKNRAASRPKAKPKSGKGRPKSRPAKRRR
jgi:hypothetical protein